MSGARVCFKVIRSGFVASLRIEPGVAVLIKADGAAAVVSIFLADSAYDAVFRNSDDACARVLCPVGTSLFKRLKDLLLHAVSGEVPRQVVAIGIPPDPPAKF